MRARAVLLIVSVVVAGLSSAAASAAPHRYPRPKPLARMTLVELGRWQAEAHSYYRGKVRSWVRRRTLASAPAPAQASLADEALGAPPVTTFAPSPAPLPKCKAAGVRLPRDYCWYARAARWTARELASTRRAIARARSAPAYYGGSAVALGQRMAAAVGWTGSEWSALHTLWDHESGWSTTAHNPGSDACGIPQAMNNCSFGYDAAAQIAWGLSYIAGRYKRPSAALAHYYATCPNCWY